MKFLFFLMIYLHITTFGFSQNLISGRVIDKGKKNILPKASIKYNSSFLLTNASGEFSIKKSLLKTLILEVSHIGYYPQKIKVESDTFLLIQLEPLINQLADFVVSTEGNSIIKKVIKRIYLNYPQRPFIQDFLILQNHLTEEKDRGACFYGKIESMVRVNTTPYLNYSVLPTVYLIANKISREESEIKLMDTTKYHDGWYQPSKLDIVHTRSFFLDKTQTKNYQFQLVDKRLYNNRKIYNISFFHKKDTSLQGFIYVDSATYAITFASFNVNNIKRLLFRTILNSENTVSYQLFGDKWYLDEACRNTDYKLSGTTTLNKGFKAIKSILIDTMNELELKHSNLIDQWADVYSFKSDDGYSFSQTFKEYFDSLHGILKQSLNIQNGTSIQTRRISQSNLFTDKILKYLVSEKVNIGFSLTKGPKFFSGIQNSISRVINSASEYSVGSNMSFSFYKKLSFYFFNANNLGVSGLNYSQNLFGITTEFSSNLISIKPIIGYNRITISDKSINLFDKSSGWVWGGIVKPKRKHLINPFFSFLIFNELYKNKTDLTVKNYKVMFSVGLFIK